ncbi:5-bromo-4-chloroindolyl phosphate hydrolysis family protein [Enterococcus faecalis]|nr:5-bromo-4-chloroindolyl phosphate hydrolysis family protein [Enterococcus faecalis]
MEDILMYFYILLFLLIVTLALTAFDIMKRYKLKVAQTTAIRQFQETNEMSVGDLQIFKETMGDAKKLIIEAEYSSSQLKDMPEEVTQALQASKEIFSKLMVKPKDLILYGDFLYRTLPAFTSALERANKMNEMQLNSMEYKQNKEEVTRFLIDLSANILEDYGQYMNEEFEETKIAHEITQ